MVSVGEGGWRASDLGRLREQRLTAGSGGCGVCSELLYLDDGQGNDVSFRFRSR